MGGDMLEQVRKIVQNGAQLIPVTVSNEKGIIKLLEMNPVPQLEDAAFPNGWTNFYRLDNYSSTCYFYLDKPSHQLKALPLLSVRTEGIRE